MDFFFGFVSGDSDSLKHALVWMCLAVQFSFFTPVSVEDPTKSHAWLTATDDAQLLRNARF